MSTDSHTIMLLRHAHAAWADAGSQDYDRPLSERGRLEAAAIGQIMRDRDLVPDRVLCSSARRTRETISIVAEILNCKDAVTYDDRLYGSDSRTYSELAEEYRDAGHLMIVGHNPMMEDFTELLSKSADEDAGRRFAFGFPTAGLAVVKVAASNPSSEPAGGHLKAFLSPRDQE